MSSPTSSGAHFANDASSAGGARRFVTATLAGWGLDELTDVASLLVSELVSNALLHAGTELDVHLRRSGGLVRVEVHDRSPRLPERKYYSSMSVTGRGLVFVAELAQSWGFEANDQGKCVWFELDETSAPEAPAMTVDIDFALDDWDDQASGPAPAASRAGTEAAAGGPGFSGRLVGAP